ncbi:MAG: indolepyruvate oxidoreductase subunit beta [Planctomycetes bacterium]|nr:indolepyruvate oxidoreductase subunit beta [Planctomycetota bacterium]
MESSGNGQNGPDRRRGWRICVVGTGGQGVLTAARLLCDAFVARGHHVVSGQLHGMAQRGGSVQSSVMIDCGISPMMAEGQADFVLGFEPVEATRALPFMSAGTIVLMNTAPVIPFVLGQQSLLEKKNIEYPDVAQLESAIRQVTERVYSFDATQLATETGTGAGSAKALNMLMLGCMLSLGKWPFSADQFWETAAQRMPPALVETSKSAFARGVEIGKAFDPAGAPL